MGDVKWREFELREVFETVPFRGGLQVPTGGLVKSLDLRDGSTPRVTVTSANNGVGGFYEDIDDANYRIYENCISVSFLGTVFYHPYRASFDMKVHCLKPIRHSFGLDALFVVAALKKHLANNGYFNQTKSTDLPYMRIELPVTSAGMPDWDYMAERIAELEAERIAELEAYLVATGLDDCELTDEDRRVLSLSLENPHLTKMDVRRLMLGFGGRSSR